MLGHLKEKSQYVLNNNSECSNVLVTMNLNDHLKINNKQNPSILQRQQNQQTESFYLTVTVKLQIQVRKNYQAEMQYF